MSQAGKYVDETLFIQSLTGDSGGAIVPDGAGNINILGGDHITTVGTANTITIDLDTDIAEDYITDSGTAQPSTGDIYILGGNNINTSAAGNVIDVSLDNAIDLPLTDATFTSGALLLNSDRFLHSYGTQNTFLGILSGNGLLTGSSNVAVGQATLFNLTSGNFNSAVGTGSLQSVTTSSFNTAVGANSLASLLSAINNVSIGYFSGDSLVIGDSNTLVGTRSLLNATGGVGGASNNIIIGNSSASAYTTDESSNIIIGNAGVVAEDNVIRIGTQGAGAGQQNSTFIAGIAGVTPASSVEVVLIDTTTGELGSGSVVSMGSVMTLTGDSGGAISPDVAGDIIVAGGSNITTAGAGNTITTDLDSTVSISGSMTAGTGFIATTGNVDILDGNLNVGTATPANPYNISIEDTVSGLIGESIQNLSTNVAAGVNLQLIVEPAAADAFVVYSVNAGATWSAGLDNSDSDKFKITTGSSPSAGTEALSIDSAGTVTLIDLNVDNLNLNGNTIISTDTNGNITLTPNGTGNVNISYLTQYLLPIAGASGAIDDLADGIGASGEVLTSNGVGAEPTWQATGSSSITITGDSGGGLVGNSFTFTGGTTGLAFAGAGSTETLGGTLIVANGGTGVSSTTAYAVLCGGTTSTNPIQSVASVGSAGEVLTSNGAGALPTFQAASAGGGITWNVATGSTQAISVNNAYFANYNGTLAFTLPTTAAVGDTVEVCQMFAGQGWTIAVNTGERLYMGNVNTTITTGTLASTDDGDWVQLVCRVANTDWQVNVKSGNITYT